MKAYVINLDRAPERWAALARLGAERGLAVERLAAVDAAAPGALAGAGYRGAGLRPAEVGCFESHRLAWARIAGGEAAHGLVLEDDVYLAGDFASWAEAVAGAAPGLDIVKLNAHQRGGLFRVKPVAEVAGRMVRQPAQCTADASAYLMTREFAVRALELHRTYARPLDVALFDPATGVRLGHADPGLAVQQKYADFAFLGAEAGATSVQLAPEARKAGRPRRGLGALVVGEARRFGRRKLLPAVQPVLNLVRPEAERLEWRRVPFAERD